MVSTQNAKDTFNVVKTIEGEAELLVEVELVEDEVEDEKIVTILVEGDGLELDAGV